MHHKTITNPKTNRQVKVRAWTINVQAVLDGLKAKTITSAKDISWQLLSDNASLQAMESTQYGEDAAHNFACSVFEHALDWTLGLAVLDTIRYFAQKGKRPKNFEVAASRNGQVFIILHSGTTWTFGS